MLTAVDDFCCNLLQVVNETILLHREQCILPQKQTSSPTQRALHIQHYHNTSDVLYDHISISEHDTIQYDMK